MVHSKDARSEALEKLGAEVVVADLLEINTIRAAAMEGVKAASLVWPIQPGLIHVTIRAGREGSGRQDIHQSFAAFGEPRLHERLVPGYLRRAGPQLVGASHHPSPSDYFLEWLLYQWPLPYLQQGTLRMPVGKGRHSPIAADDQGRAIAALMNSPEEHIGKTIPLSGPVEMDHR
jgi:NAD(P)H dehydrogenase (quinone)